MSTKARKKPRPAAPDQLRLVTAIGRELERQGFHDAQARHLNAVIEAANLIVSELSQEYRPAIPVAGLAKWLESDDTGLSSMAMARRLAPIAGLTVRMPGPRFGLDPDSHPHDPADLGRCVKLLDAEPSLRPHLSAMAAASPVWAALIGAWDELEALYREELPSGRAPKCYERMRALIEGAEKKAATT